MCWDRSCSNGMAEYDLQNLTGHMLCTFNSFCRNVIRSGTSGKLEVSEKLPNSRYSNSNEWNLREVCKRQTRGNVSSFTRQDRWKIGVNTSAYLLEGTSVHFWSSKKITQECFFCVCVSRPQNLLGLSWRKLSWWKNLCFVSCGSLLYFCKQSKYLAHLCEAFVVCASRKVFFLFWHFS